MDASASLDGYREPTRHDISDRAVAAGRVLVAVVGTVLYFPSLLADVATVDGAALERAVAYPLARPLDTVGFLVVLAVVATGLELGRAVALRGFGSDPETLSEVTPGPLPRAVSSGGVVSRAQLVVTLAGPPLVVVAVATLAVAPAMPDPIVRAGKVALVANGVLAVRPVLSAVALARYPRGTLCRRVPTDGDVATYCYVPYYEPEPAALVSRGDE